MSTVEEWLERRPDERAVLGAFTRHMAEELAANTHKGDRPGWLSCTPRELVSEVLYHAAKMTYALRQSEQGEGPPERVVEFAADTANMAMMVVDCAGVLVVPQRCSTCGAWPHEECGRPGEDVCHS